MVYSTVVSIHIYWKESEFKWTLSSNPLFKGQLCVHVYLKDNDASCMVLSRIETSL